MFPPLVTESPPLTLLLDILVHQGDDGLFFHAYVVLTLESEGLSLHQVYKIAPISPGNGVCVYENMYAYVWRKEDKFRCQSQKRHPGLER